MIFDAKACHAAYEVTDETAVYTCTGNPHPSDIEDIMNSMMNDSFETSYRSQFRFSYSRSSCSRCGLGISTLKAEKGLALQDIISGIYDYVATIVFPAQTRVYILDQLAQVE